MQIIQPTLTLKSLERTPREKQNRVSVVQNGRVYVSKRFFHGFKRPHDESVHYFHKLSKIITDTNNICNK